MKVRVKLTPGQESLNPYYTGIHLHMTQLICLPRHICLNHYYTGIHIHKVFVEGKFNFDFRLNPYYTGIHLHKM